MSVFLGFVMKKGMERGREKEGREREKRRGEEGCG
jgi:hypothetical protein